MSGIRFKKIIFKKSARPLQNDFNGNGFRGMSGGNPIPCLRRDDPSVSGKNPLPCKRRIGIGRQIRLLDCNLNVASYMVTILGLFSSQ